MLRRPARLLLPPLPLAVAVGVAVALCAASGASAHKKYALKEGVECKECHDNPEGGGPRNLIGEYYQAKKELPLDRSPEGMKLVRDTVDRWMQTVLATPPVVRWPHKPLDEQPGAAKPKYERASDEAILRRLSLDLRSVTPSPDELQRLKSGKLTLDQAVDDFIDGKDFFNTFMLYHKDIVRPRTGDYNTDSSYSKLSEVTVDGERVLTSQRFPGEAGAGKCSSMQRVKVSPWWDRTGLHYACKDTANEAVTLADGTRCDNLAGQKTGKCGCGPFMLFCYVPGLHDKIIGSMKEENARIAMEVVKNHEPYPDLLTVDWTMNDGWLEVFYAKLEDRLADLKDPDGKRPWHKVERDPRHSGVLTTPEMFNFFYNGRRWAQRTFESFFCHEVYPDFDLLDDTNDSGAHAAVPYRDSALLEPSLTVTESRACAACHMQLDGLARVHDRWDPWGRYHETSPRGLVIPQRSMFMGQEVDGIDGLGKVLAASDLYADCALNQLWEHMLGHRFQPDELSTRKKLLADWKADGLDFKKAIKLIAATDEYTAKGSLKLMTRELYSHAIGRSTDVAWKVGGTNGWDLYYDKLGGMDYRKIELRDIRPGQGHSLAQMKGAAEVCDQFVTREKKKDDHRLFIVAGDVDGMPSDKDLDQNLARLYVRAYAREWSDVPSDEKKLMRDLFKRVAKKKSAADGYRAVCTAVYGSEDFALF